MHQGLSRAALGLVLLFFCLPLFIRLDGLDLENDEAIYSFAVDRILETGEWLTPKSLPSDVEPFLEKPPLKFWLVAAGIRLGLLPHNEIGYRFWDAAFGVGVFVYTFLIATRLSHVLGGLAAALILFVHLPLSVLHGLRANVMEAAVTLAYCGGIYHFLAWAAATRRESRTTHIGCVALYFVLGFMTKFVAVAFLPLVLGLTVLVASPIRGAFVRDAKMWLAAGIASAALIIPWFAYEHVQYGSTFWSVILGSHVYERFTSSLDPQHLQPWGFYLTSLYREFDRVGLVVFIGAGLVLLMIEAFVWRRTSALLMLLWFAVPVTLISLGTSKLYHYVYPFLPPLAIAGGCVVAFIATMAQGALEAGVRAGGGSPVRRPILQHAFALIGITALAIGVATALYGPLRISVGGVLVLRNQGILRPVLVALGCALLGGRTEWATRFLVPLAALALLPTAAYRETLSHIAVVRHPLRNASACVAGVAARNAAVGTPPRGLYVDVPDGEFIYPVFYYLRRIRPFQYASPHGSDAVRELLNAPDLQRPVLIGDDRYRQAVSRGVIPQSTPVTRLETGLLLLLPGPYAECAPGFGSSTSS